MSRNIQTPQNPFEPPLLHVEHETCPLQLSRVGLKSLLIIY